MSPSNIADPEKNQANNAVDITEVNAPPSTGQQSEQHYTQGSSHDQSAEWQPGFWRQFPFIPFVSLLGVLASLIVTLYILIASNGKAVGQWGYGVAPSVYLAIVTLIGNVLLSIALVHGLIISFWRTALKGCTLNELNRNWNNGNSLWSCATAGWGKGGRVTALARVLVLIGLVRGPLNQRASRVQPDARFETQGLLPLNIATKLPDGYTGMNKYSRSQNMDTARLTSNFNTLMVEYSDRGDIQFEHAECGDQCRTTVKGFGFKVDCEITNHTHVATPPFSETMFETSTTIYQIANETMEDGYTWTDTGILLNATYFVGLGSEPAVNNDTNFLFNLTYSSHLCHLTPGSVPYSVQLSKNQLLYLGWRPPTEFFEKIPLSSPNQTTYNTTIGGFQYAMAYLFDSSATYDFGGAVSSLSLKGSLANQMVLDKTDESQGIELYQDPMEYLLHGIAEIALRASVKAGTDDPATTNAHQTSDYNGQLYLPKYVTNRAFMIAGAVLGFISLVAVAITLYGWWELGREMSMSPLEIAKAFDAPMLRDAGSNVSHYQMKTPALGRRIKYGEVVEDVGTSTGVAGGKATRRAALAISDVAESPQRGQKYQP